MKKFLEEFKGFALKGNVMDLAVGVIIGAAFQAVVASLTENIFAPIISLFSKQSSELVQWEIFGIKYGAFITSVVNFVIMAFVVFLLVKAMNHIVSLGKKEEQKEETTKKCPYCLSEIHIKATRCPACTSQLEK